jgi:hypothetical protein
MTPVMEQPIDGWPRSTDLGTEGAKPDELSRERR